MAVGKIGTGRVSVSPAMPVWLRTMRVRRVIQSHCVIVSLGRRLGAKGRIGLRQSVPCGIGALKLSDFGPTVSRGTEPVRAERLGVSVVSGLEAWKSSKAK